MNNALTGWTYGPRKKPTPVDPYADLPSLSWDVRDYRDGPQMNLDALDTGWQRGAAPDADYSGTAGRFAAPNALAPPMDRQSSNVLTPSMLDFTIEAAKLPVMNRVRTLTEYVPHLAKSFFGPEVSMSDISAMLPKELMPYMGKK